MTSPVRFAILGFGHHAVRRLVPAFARSDRAILTGIWRRNQVAAERDCREYNIPLCFATAEALCASPEVDVVFITSPDALHRNDCLLALRHGKAVLCEKPLAMNAAEAREIVAAARFHGLLFGVAQNFRYNRSLALLRDRVAAGAIGTPQFAHAQFTYPAANSPRIWIQDRALACGGPIGDVGVHCIDALCYVLDAEVQSVSTLAHAAPGTSVEAEASLQLQMSPGDLVATVTVSATAAYRSLIEITGSDGVLIAENALSVDQPVDVILRRAGELVETQTVDNHDGYVLMLDDCAAALRNQSAFRATGPQAIHNMQVLDAAYRSWHTGQRESLRASS